MNGKHKSFLVWIVIIVGFVFCYFITHAIAGTLYPHPEDSLAAEFLEKADPNKVQLLGYDKLNSGSCLLIKYEDETLFPYGFYPKAAEVWKEVKEKKRKQKITEVIR